MSCDRVNCINYKSCLKNRLSNDENCKFYKELPIGSFESQYNRNSTFGLDIDTTYDDD